MKPIAIVYTSNTGFTAQYASLLGGETGLPVYTLEDAEKSLPRSSPILYLGWLMAGKVQGYAKANGRFRIAAVCGVGMGAPGSQNEDIRKANALPASLPLFTLQGGFDMTRLHGVYRLMMTVMSKTVGKKLADKPDRSPEEDDMLELLQNGGSRVSEAQLAGVLEWYAHAQ